MPEFINKAKNDNDFNNYGFVTKGGGTNFQYQINKPNISINAIGNALPVDAKKELENKIDIQSENSGSTIQAFANVDPISGLPPCPGAQTRVGLTIDLSIGDCGCWVSTGLSITDLLTLGGASAADTIWSIAKKGSPIGRREAAINGVLDKIKSTNKFDETWQNRFDTLKKIQRDTLEKNRTLAKQFNFLDGRISDLNKEIEKIEILLDSNSNDLIDVGNSINEIQENLQDIFISEEVRNSLQQELNRLQNFQQNILDNSDSLLLSKSLMLQELQIKQPLLDKVSAELNENGEILDNTYAALSTFDNDKRDAEYKLLSQAINQVDNMASSEILTLALSWIGFTISALEFSRTKICMGQNTVLNQQTCECECTAPDDMIKCEGQATITSSILGIFIPDIDELQTFCSTKCSCGQVSYQVGNSPCGCACLGEIPFGGTLIAGGGSVDDYFKSGEGCECLQPGYFWSTRGKCISRDTENRALAQGKQWNGAICDFECPNGPPADCVGNATRPPKINYGGLLIDDECGECVCDGSSFSCNTDEGYVKDTSLGVCDCVYDPVTTENINLIP